MIKCIKYFDVELREVFYECVKFSKVWHHSKNIHGLSRSKSSSKRLAPSTSRVKLLPLVDINVF